jgi:16S rRNA (cytidine1402-2'-O)-methyltransferase
MTNNTTDATLYLIPVPLGEGSSFLFSQTDVQVILNIKHFIVETYKPAKRFIHSLYKANLPDYQEAFDRLEWYQISDMDTQTTRELIKEGAIKAWKIGLVSDAGCPAVADPGANIVRLAHYFDYQVEPMIGPSSILLALMASGLGGQQFAFHGYLPSKTDIRVKKIKYLERESFEKDQTQLFIETPYRNEALFRDLITHLSPETLLSIAVDLTLSNQFIRTMEVLDWQKLPLPPIQKRLCLFSFKRTT